MAGKYGNGRDAGDIRLPDDVPALEEISPADVLLALPKTLTDDATVSVATASHTWNTLEKERLTHGIDTDYDLPDRRLIVSSARGTRYRVRTRPAKGDVALERRVDADWAPWAPVTGLRVTHPKRCDHEFLYEQRVEQRRPWREIGSDLGYKNRGGNLSQFADDLGFHEVQSVEGTTTYSLLAHEYDADDVGEPFPDPEGGADA